MGRNCLSNFGRGSPKEPSCKIILKSVQPFWRRSRLKQKVDNARNKKNCEKNVKTLIKKIFKKNNKKLEIEKFKNNIVENRRKIKKNTKNKYNKNIKKILIYIYIYIYIYIFIY